MDAGCWKLDAVWCIGPVWHLINCHAPPHRLTVAAFGILHLPACLPACLALPQVGWRRLQSILALVRAPLSALILIRDTVFISVPPALLASSKSSLDDISGQHHLLLPVRARPRQRRPQWKTPCLRAASLNRDLGNQY